MEQIKSCGSFDIVVIFCIDSIKAYASSSYDTYYLALIIFIVIFFIMFYHIMFHSEPQSCICSCRTTYMEIKQMGNSTNLAGKIEHAQFTVQDSARLPCKIARQLLCNIATCRISCKVLHAICCKISCAQYYIM